MSAIYRFKLRGAGFHDRWPEAEVYDAETGERLGEAMSYIYGGTAWCVSTRAFGGHMAFDSVCIEYGADPAESVPFNLVQRDSHAGARAVCHALRHLSPTPELEASGQCPGLFERK